MESPKALIVSQFPNPKVQQLCSLRFDDVAMSRTERFGQPVLEDSTGKVRYG